MKRRPPLPAALCAGLTLAAVAVAGAAGAAAGRPELRFADRPQAPSFGTVEVRGLPAVALERLAAAELDAAGRERLLAVRTLAAGDDGPAVLGDWELSAGVLRFRPRFAFRSGLAYRAVLDGAAVDRLTGAASGSTPALELVFTMPAPPPTPPARVAAVYPSADLLPENQLRLYVWFSAPMRRRQVAGGVRLIDADSGEPVELPFVEIPDGLWDPAGRRLTLFFHPGRIKRGVGPGRTLGPPLREGGRYRLEIDPALRDAAGRELAAGQVKGFRVGPPDRRSPDPGAWRLTPPARPGDRLTVEFPEPLDHGLLLRLLEVRDAQGLAMAGKIEVTHGERRWSFVPAAPWRPGSYRLRVATALEDLAGNSLRRRFDEEAAGAPGPAPPAATHLDLEFVFAPQPGGQPAAGAGADRAAMRSSSGSE